MQVHALDLSDFCEEDYFLIGIHTALEDFKLAYLLNNRLKTKLSRASYSLDFKNKSSASSYSVYAYANEKYDFEWYLIANSCTTTQTNADTSLLFQTETTTHLIPEKRTVDYFLKIVGEADYDYLKRSIERLNSIPQIVTSYIIEKDSLKSKDHLIF